MRPLSPVILVCLLLMQVRCSDVAGPGDERVVRALTLQEQHVVTSGNTFGLALFRALNEGATGENVFLSPLSVSMALGMTLNGAAGDTRSAMEETLALAGLSAEEINASYQSLIALLQDLDPRVVFQLANAIWYRAGFPVEDAFVDVN